MDLTPDRAALAVERHDYPNCDAPAGSACRTRGGKTAAKYHTPRFVLVGRQAIHHIRTHCQPPHCHNTERSHGRRPPTRSSTKSPPTADESVTQVTRNCEEARCE
ncbi:hypothetical protein [Streptomyces sp. NRRL WC-3725]|uniref:zinc finger domain-containing protein n=1 Tax=Streptomyces sp. NRRL WC-3725 TaxID=1463933 RepID=UPI00099B6F0A